MGQYKHHVFVCTSGGTCPGQGGDAVFAALNARKGVLEQTRRHLAVAALLRVPHVIVAVNKIDLVDFDVDIYTEVAADLAGVASELGLPDLRAVPVSALEGDNVVDRSSRTDWYAGPSLLEILEALPVADDPGHEEFRFPVQLTLRPQAAARDAAHREYRGYAGQIASGVVRVGDEVVVLPGGRRTTIAGIDTADGELAEAFAPRSVSLRLTDDIDVARGDLIAAASSAPEPTRDLVATVCWLSDVPLSKRSRVLLKHTTRTTRAIISAVDGVLDLDAVQLERDGEVLRVGSAERRSSDGSARRVAQDLRGRVRPPDGDEEDDHCGCHGGDHRTETPGRAETACTCRCCVQDPVDTVESEQLLLTGMTGVHVCEQRAVVAVVQQVRQP